MPPRTQNPPAGNPPAGGDGELPVLTGDAATPPVKTDDISEAELEKLTQPDPSPTSTEAAVQQLAAEVQPTPAAVPQQKPMVIGAPDQSAPETVEPTVTMIVPKDVTITEAGGLRTFKAGIREIPERLQDHWYLVANGVKKYVKE